MALRLTLHRHLRPLHSPASASFLSRFFFNSSGPFPFIPTPGSGDVSEKTYHERKILPYSRRQLYDVVSDFKSYNKFLPYCTACRVVKAEPFDHTDRTERKDVEMTVGFLTFQESYISKVTCKPYLSVEAVAASSTPLFKKLSTTWRFQPANSSSPHPSASAIPPGPFHASQIRDAMDDDDRGPTLISIDLIFAFSNPIYAGISEMFFDKISHMMVEAFEKRCLQVYGPGKQ